MPLPADIGPSKNVIWKVDLPPGQKSGLDQAVSLLADVDGIEAVRFGVQDVVRRDLVARIVEAYEASERKT